MKLLFTGTVPVWLVVLIFAVFALFTAIVYRRQNLPRTWAIILGTCRITAGALLISALLQPIVARIRMVKVRGRIPVIMDTSGSMSIADSYNGIQGMRTAWQMNLFARTLRCTAFTECRHQLADTKKELNQFAGILDTLPLQEMPDKTVHPQIKKMRRKISGIHKNFATLQKDLVKEVSTCPYLDASDRDPEANRYEKYRQDYKDLETWFSNQNKRFNVIARLAKDFPNPQQKAKRASQTLNQLHPPVKKLLSDWSDGLAQLNTVQKSADELLTAADMPAVSTAIKQLSSMPRVKLAARLLTSGSLKLEDLRQRGEVDLFSLDEPIHQLPDKNPFDKNTPNADIPDTRIGSIIRKIVRQYGDLPIAAVILLSDGNNNAGFPPGETASFLKQRGIPLLTVGIGNATPPPDIAIGKVIAPHRAFRDDMISVSCTIHRHGFAKQPLQVSLRVDGTNQVAATAEIPGDGRRKATITLHFAATGSGSRRYRIKVQKMDGEALLANNESDFSVNILSDPLRALLIDEYPRWESRYLCMMMEKDPRVAATTIFAASADTENQLPRGTNGFPADRLDLFAYDLVILGDVDPQRFTENDLKNIKEFATDRSGALLVLAGPSFMPRAYRHTPISDILPVHSLPRPIRAGEEQPLPAQSSPENLRLQLSGPAEFEPAIRLATTPDVNRRLWQELPSLNWTTAQIEATPNARVMIKTADQYSAPVIASAFSGLGKVIYIGSDSFWRWRKNAGYTYHHRLWSQLLLWATAGRTAGNNRFFKLITDRNEYSPGETVNLQARIFGESGQPLLDATAAVRIVNSWGDTVRNVLLQPVPDSGGEYRGEIHDLPRGIYRAIPEVSQLKDVVQNVSFPFKISRRATSEYIELALDETKLRSFSSMYRYFPEADQIVPEIPVIEKVERRREDYEVWDSFYVLIAVAALLGFEWQMRKQQKLI